MTTYIKPSRDNASCFFVETWYDRSTRSWVTQTKNADWDQIGDASYSATKRAAHHEHYCRATSLCDGRPSVLHTFSK